MKLQSEQLTKRERRDLSSRASSSLQIFHWHSHFGDSRPILLADVDRAAEGLQPEVGVAAAVERCRGSYAGCSTTIVTGRSLLKRAAEAVECRCRRARCPGRRSVTSPLKVFDVEVVAVGPVCEPPRCTRDR